jgi:hypothetical protein
MGRIGEPKREIHIPVPPPAEPIEAPEPAVTPTEPTRAPEPVPAGAP